MQNTPERFNLSLRTGFFKTELYTVAVSREALVFTPACKAGEASQFKIDCSDVDSVVVFSTPPAELEIRTAKEVFTGTFKSRADAAEAAAALRAVFGKRFWGEGST